MELGLEPGKVDHDDVEHRQRQDDKEHGDRQIEPWRCVDCAERAGREDHDETQPAVHRRHRRTVSPAQEEAPQAGAGLRAGADDGEIDRNHRQHAGCQVQSKATEQDERQDGERALALEQAFLNLARFGCMDEPEKVVAPEVATGRAQNAELVEQPDNITRRRRALYVGRRPDGLFARDARRRALERDAGKQLGVSRGECVVTRDDRERELGTHGGRQVARGFVAGLVPERGRDDVVP